ncbi:TRAP transporter small permease [Pseudogracilibacillus sp. SE30717A]|uniref:TRAP transporter small permease subunit n=1 Tax=Pseudogracilibacillus sp. SE30717A TaxID=3098293 RepID=UPI00300E35D4
MALIIRIIDKISNAFGTIAGITMVLGVVLVLTEVIVRSAFNSTIYITQEYTAYFMVAITFFGLAYTLKEKGHIRLTFLHKIVKSGKGRTFLDIYAFTLGLVIFAIITFATVDFFLGTYASGTRSMQITKTYLAIPQFAMPLGSFIVSLQFFAEILKSIVKFKKGEFDEEDDTEIEALGR